jgi:hypothetical protein
MRKKLAGLAVALTLFAGVAPFVSMGTAHADTVTANNTTTTDPVLCFVAAQAIITEALHEFREGHLTAAELRVVLVGTASFLGDCLNPA